jgi:hypothetical protein
VTHRATPSFWDHYRALPEAVQRTADRCYALLKVNPRHPSLHFKKIGRYWSVRVCIHHRSLAVERGDDLIWFWIGTHAEYDRLIG